MQLSFPWSIFKSQSLKYAADVKHLKIDSSYTTRKDQNKSPISHCLLFTKDLFSVQRSDGVNSTTLLKSEAHWHYQQQAERGSECNCKEYEKIETLFLWRSRIKRIYNHIQWVFFSRPHRLGGTIWK